MKRMMRMLAAALAAMICLSGVAALAGGSVTTTGSVNLRRGPGLEYASIRAISAGTTLTWDDTSTDERSVRWYRVRYRGDTGWVSSRYATADGRSGNWITTTANVNLRAGAGTEYVSLRVVDSGSVLSYDDAERDFDGALWYHVTYKGDSGWIIARYTREGGGSSGGSSGGGSGEGRVTTTGSVHLRSGAGLDYAIRDTVPEGVTLSYDKTSTDERGVTWYRVSYKGRTGWLSSKYAKRGGGSSGGGARSVKMTGSAHVRSGPGLDFSVLGTAGDGATLTYAGETKKDDRGVAWYSVKYRGEYGWVSSKYARRL